MQPLARKHLPAVLALRAVRRRSSRILLYHGVGEAGRPEDEHNLVVGAERFQLQLSLLAAAGFRFVTVAELAAATPDGGSPPAGLISISFDDGMEDNYTVAAPVMAQMGITGTIYVLTGSIGQDNPWLSGERMMTSAELSSLAGAGHELGAHTVTHPDLSALDYESCLAEMTASRDAIAEISGSTPQTFAYPFGHYGAAAIRAAKAAGFKAAVTCINRGSWAPLEMKRTLITGRDEIASFVARVSGVYEPLVLGRAGSVARGATARLRRRTPAGPAT